MRIISAAFSLVIGLTLTTACAAPTDESESSSQGVTQGERAVAEENFHPKSTCSPYRSEWDFGELYSPPDIDLSDRAHPKYRIRHNSSADEIIGKQNINIYLRDGSVWRSEDNLIARRTYYGTSMDAYDAARRNDPWEPLPVPKEFLDKAFQITEHGKYNLRAWEVVMNEIGPDKKCRKEFYFP